MPELVARATLPWDGTSSRTGSTYGAEEDKFEKELATLLNKWNRDTVTGIPDFQLAHWLNSLMWNLPPR